MCTDVLSIDQISTCILSTFFGLVVVDAWGEKSFFYNPQRLLKRGIYFCTIKEKDGDNDSASALYRSGVFRLNFGVPKSTFAKLFGMLPSRPSKGGVIGGTHDFTALDLLMPHPVYGWMAWVSILNPSEKSWIKIEQLLAESYKLVLEKYVKKQRALD